MTVAKAYEMFMQEQQFRGNSQYTIEYYKRALSMFLNFCNSDMEICDIDVLLFKSYQLYISNNLPINRISVRTYTRAVKVFIRWLFFEGYIDLDINKLTLMKASKYIIVPLSDNEVTQLVNLYNNNNFMNCRNRTIVMLMIDCGLRLGEVVNLCLSDIDYTNNYLIINGKGSKQRLIPFGKTLSEQLGIYNSYRKKFDVSNNLFLNNKLQPITHNAIKMLFARIKKVPNLKRIYPHLLRHTFATNFIYDGGNLEVLRVLMGHSSINITQIYIHLAAQKHLLNDCYNSKLDNLLKQKTE